MQRGFAVKRFVLGLVALVALSGAGRLEARGDLFTLDISYSGPNLGVSGTGVLQAISVGGGEYEAVSGYINATLAGVSGTVYETLVPNANFGTNFGSPPGTSVFENSNGDETTYDNTVFISPNSPASTDGAQLTYAGGLMFQTANPSTQDVYLSAYSPGTFSGYYYFAGWNSQGLLGNGSMNTLSITMGSSFDPDSISAPEPSSFVTVPIAAVCAAALALARRRKFMPV